jgi:hypothetical protein
VKAPARPNRMMLERVAELGCRITTVLIGVAGGYLQARGNSIRGFWAVRS